IKLWNYLGSHPFDKDAFDIPLTIEDQSNWVCLPHNEFSTFEQIRVAAENNISICFGAAAITLWEAISEKNSYANATINPSNTTEEMLAGLSYMIRCCFAHGTVVPKWKISDKYKIIYKVSNKTVDLRAVDGKPFDYEAIGGYETLWLLKAEARANGLL
ncbi:MAG: hypothetical protein ACRD2L_02050, partial [Terriglobia bacterium]